MKPLIPARLKDRADFLRAQRGVRKVAAGLTLEICFTPDKNARKGCFRVGFTASRKVGNAVVRNRAKRRLRALAQAVLPLAGQECTDYVLVARAGTLIRPFAALQTDLAGALQTAHLRLDQGGKERP
jgi:ribonuclease P protein component